MGDSAVTAADSAEGRELLTVTVEDRGGVLVVALVGELDFSSSGLLRRTLDELAMGDEPFVVDLGRLDFIDSSGLGCLVRAHRKARVLQRSMAVACPPAGAGGRLLQVTGLDHVLRTYGSVDQAVSQLRGSSTSE
ncbi:hypothetical protein GCM10009798_06340 [Nocardioides panacihumi]|uniref:Anti-sigma factor antagonist n=1 Tax=Nocardioides panacihumi TaxID=400774 RepID=A0ABN2QFZ8_9ACTN